MLNEFVRAVLQEQVKYLYHMSPRPDIGKFDPRHFIHNDDYSESGIWTSDAPPPEGFQVSNLVFAARKSYAPFYSLPREMPRILVHLESPEELDRLRSVLSGEEITKKRVLILPAASKQSVQNHIWTEYGFDKRDFSPLPGNVEFVARKSVAPVFKKTHKDPARYIKSKGIDVVFVADLQEIERSLRDMGMTFDLEG